MESKKIKRLMCSVITATLLLSEVPGVAPVMESVGIVREVEAASVKLTKTKVSVLTGEKYSVTLNGVSSKKKKSVKWTSSNKNLVVTYSKKDARKVTFYAKKAGTYKVTATYGKKSYTVTVKAKKGMNTTNLTLNNGKKYTLKLSNVKGKIKWKSSKTSVATVKAAKNGKSASIVAKNPGTTTIIATVGKKKLYSTVVVKGMTAVVTPSPIPTTAPKPTTTPKPQPTATPKPTESPKPSETPKPTATPTPEVVKANEIKLDKEELTFWVLNQTDSIKATVKPNDAEDKKVGWNSTDMSVVTVDQGGTVTAVGNGNAYVICFLKSNPEVFARCEVTVQAPEPTKPATVKAESISLNYKSINLDGGSYYTEYLIPTIKPDNSDQTEVGWESENTNVATVSEDGVVTAMGTGTTKVRCYIKDNRSIYAECTVNVDLDVKVNYISVSPSSLSLEFGDSSRLSATVSPSDATNNKVEWSSSSPSVASVSDDGTVTAKSSGSAIITCKAIDGSGVSASCTVSVVQSTTDTGETDPPIDSGDTGYTFKVRGGSLKTKSVFNGGDLANILITTNAPLNKISVFVSNNSIQYYSINYNSNYDYYSISLYARKKSSACRVSIDIGGRQVWFKDVVISSDDQNWALYESWLGNSLSAIKASNSGWDSSNAVSKITALGQYLLDNYNYSAEANATFWKTNSGNCEVTAFVLKDFAQRYLNLDAQVVNPSYWSSNISHVVARVSIGGKYYDFDASATGKAGNRGNVVVKILDK